jgi:hypothetical protein
LLRRTIVKLAEIVVCSFLALLKFVKVVTKTIVLINFFFFYFVRSVVAVDVDVV